MRGMMMRSVVKLLNPDRWLITTDEGEYKVVYKISDEDYKLWENREQFVKDADAILED
jgi:hypothetical protein